MLLVLSLFFALILGESFFCAMIAAITLKVLDPFGTGKIVLFQVTYDKVCIYDSQKTKRMTIFCKDWHVLELLPFIFLGVFGVRVVDSVAKDLHADDC